MKTTMIDIDEDYYDMKLMMKTTMIDIDEDYYDRH